MKTIKSMKHLTLTMLFLIFSTMVFADAVKPASPPAGFKHQYATVNGVKIHYVAGGKGEPLLLIHGFGQNWYMWNRLLPELTKHFTVIAPDMRCVGESCKPAGGGGGGGGAGGGRGRGGGRGGRRGN